MKFNETLEDIDFKNIRFTEKYVTVYIESPDIISYDDTLSIIMRNDEMFTDFSVGNDDDFRDFCRKAAEMPEKLPDWLRNRTPRSYYEILEKQYEKELEAFNNSWNRNPYGVWGVFSCSLFCSAWCNGPRCFVNYSTGKVEGYNTIGKWPESLSECVEELEWFARLYPQYKFFLTFEDAEIVCTLMLFNGEIRPVKTRTREQVQHCLTADNLKGSTCAERPGFIERFLDKVRINNDLDSLKYKIAWHVSCIPLYIWHWPKNWFYDNIAKRFFRKAYNEHVINVNYRMQHVKHEKYFDYAHASEVISEWLQVLRETSRK